MNTKILQVLRAFGIPQRKHLYFISVSGAFLKTSLPTKNTLKATGRDTEEAPNTPYPQLE
jgi:hypothetical protein